MPQSVVQIVKTLDAISLVNRLNLLTTHRHLSNRQCMLLSFSHHSDHCVFWYQRSEFGSWRRQSRAHDRGAVQNELNRSLVDLLMWQDEWILVKGSQSWNVIGVTGLHESNDSEVIGKELDVIFAFDHFEVLLLW